MTSLSDARDRTRLFLNFLSRSRRKVIFIRFTFILGFYLKKSRNLYHHSFDTPTPANVFRRASTLLPTQANRGAAFPIFLTARQEAIQMLSRTAVCQFVWKGKEQIEIQERKKFGNGVSVPIVRVRLACKMR